MLDSPPTPTQPVHRRALKLEPVPCAVCGASGAPIVGSGEDFEYRTSDDEFRARRCDTCGLVYLDPRPAASELDRIYGPDYHAFAFTAEAYGLVHRVRRRLEARRLLCACEGLPANARILDVGCGDGFHLDLLREYGRPTWRLMGVDPSSLAVEAARRRGLDVRLARVEEIPVPDGGVDLVLLIQTIEHLAEPGAALVAIRRALAPGGRLVVVTDNTDSPDFTLFRRRHWGGYHFPRHFCLFAPRPLTRLAAASGLHVESLTTIVSPVNWVYSIHNLLADHGAPEAMVRFFTLRSPLALGVFTAVDLGFQLVGRGALLRAVLRPEPR
ncbi:MAG: class I SAM-dependent methyltransferase [Deltaproteobacteria bacterium]|nr:class I SAM-dependent methyltransferase [Deltaproteobacteria bacterium]